MVQPPSNENSWREDIAAAAPETAIDTLTVRYKTTLGWAIVVLGGINVVLGIWLLLLGQLVSAGILGILFLIVGYLYLKRTYFDVKPDRITVYNLLGNVVKRYPLTPNEQLLLKNNKVVIEQAGMERKVAVSSFLIKNEDWAALESRLGNGE